MEKYKGMGFKAVDIEHSFAIFLGKEVGARGESYDADVFRGGSTPSLGRALEDFCSRAAQRVSGLKFDAAEGLPAGAKIRIESALSSLAGITGDMKMDKGREPDDYHWMIIGQLVALIAGILDHIEGKGAGAKK